MEMATWEQIAPVYLIKRRVALEVALGAAHNAQVQMADVTFQPPSRVLPSPAERASKHRSGWVSKLGKSEF